MHTLQTCEHMPFNRDFKDINMYYLSETITSFSTVKTVKIFMTKLFNINLFYHVCVRFGNLH